LKSEFSMKQAIDHVVSCLAGRQTRKIKFDEKRQEAINAL
jgi:hypothetical protein